MANKRTQSRDRIIGARLRAIRKERAKLSVEAAAKVAQWAPARLSRTKNGQRQVTTEEVATLLTAYRIPVAEREEVLAQLGTGAGWWERELPGAPFEVGALASYETNAIELVNVSIYAVPGLLQIYETAKAILAAAGSPPEDIETRWMARLRRQQILGTVDYTAYIGEAALHTPFGGHDALRAQLEHLAGARDRGIGVRIVPENQTRCSCWTRCCGCGSRTRHRSSALR
ncbi:MAG TPA: Scr1 family TA system antitoxin-like transcriptional regulator [Actinophytocola sp.]|nr:Scr1 family TA system antitoxin-like transcriptional regulator [Actinophytocola sp.]